MQSLHLNHSRGQQWLGLDLYFLQLSSPTFAVSHHYSEEEKTARNIEGINVTSTIIFSVFH